MTHQNNTHRANLAELKARINASEDIFNQICLCYYGVQAYGLNEGEEYTVITRANKDGGRYYFVDRSNVRHLVAHCSPVVVADFLDQLDDDAQIIAETVATVQKHGQTVVNSAFLARTLRALDPIAEQAGKIAKSELIGFNGFNEGLHRVYLAPDPQSKPQATESESEPQAAQSESEPQSEPQAAQSESEPQSEPQATESESEPQATDPAKG